MCVGRVWLWCWVVLMGCSGQQWTPIAEFEGEPLPVCRAPAAMLASPQADAVPVKASGTSMEDTVSRGGPTESVETGGVGVVFDFSEAADASGISAASGPTPTPSRGDCIDLNEASAMELVALPGVGPGRARQIVARRERRRFRTKRELKRIKGIGAKTYAKMAPMLCDVE